MLRGWLGCCFVSFWIVAAALEGQENGFFADERRLPHLNTFADDIALYPSLNGLEAVLKSAAEGRESS